MNVDAWAQLVIAIAAFDWAMAVLLVMLARRHHWAVLTERAWVSIAIAGGVSCAAVLGWNLLSGFGLSADVRFALILGMALIPSLANVSWLVALFLGRFHDGSGQ